jgi:hypothetical protein
MGVLEFGSGWRAFRVDFNALFIVIDADDNGYVDFVEFCAFLAKGHDEFDTARGGGINRGSVMERSSRRISVVETTTRRISNLQGGATAGDLKDLEKLEDVAEDVIVKNADSST